MHQIRFRLGPRPRLSWGAYSAPPFPFLPCPVLCVFCYVQIYTFFILTIVGCVFAVILFLIAVVGAARTGELYCLTSGTTDSSNIYAVAICRQVAVMDGSQLQQEAQLLLGDRATRKHAKDC